ncbi:MAG: hypothetical protein LBD40_02065 [Puniceicoccales bacterium]|jgi:hypothetical protein|nr:hypothetical protein [Puniceicoccales bacterium]
MGYRIQKLSYFWLFLSVMSPLRSEMAPEATETLEWIPSALPVETGSFWTPFTCFFLLTLTILTVGMIYGIIRYRRRHRAIPERSLTSAEQLMVDLKKARQAIVLPQADAFAMLLTTGIRRYIEREFPQQSRTQTTEEFLQSFQQIECIDWGTQSSLCDVLRFGDQVKFAGRELQKNERRMLYGKACSLALTLRRLYRRRQKEKTSTANSNPNPKNLTISAVHD